MRASAWRQAGAGFLGDVRRLCVLLTRAKRGLILFGHAATLVANPAWASLLVHLGRAGLLHGSGLAPLTEAMRFAPPAQLLSPHDLEVVDSPGGPGAWHAFSGGQRKRGWELQGGTRNERTATFNVRQRLMSGSVQGTSSQVSVEDIEL